MGSVSEQLFARAREVIPGGVNSPVRSWRAVGGNPLFIARGDGARVTDADGRTLRRLRRLVGSAHPRVTLIRRSCAAIVERAALGTSFGAPTALRGRARAAARGRAAVGRAGAPGQLGYRGDDERSPPGAGGDRPGRDRQVRRLLPRSRRCAPGPRRIRGAHARRPGQPRDARGRRRADAARRVQRRRRAPATLLRSAAEPRSRPSSSSRWPETWASCPPAPGFLEMLREETARVGRAARLRRGDDRLPGRLGRRTGALSGSAPDLTCLGKIIGGGMPLAAFGGRRDLMQLIAPAGPVYQAGTLSGNPISVERGTGDPAGAPAGAGRLRSTRGAGTAGRGGAARRARRRGDVRGCVQPGGLDAHALPRRRRGARLRRAPCAPTPRRFARFFLGMLDQGVYLPPSQFEALFLSLAHDETDIDRLVGAARRVLAGL